MYHSHSINSYKIYLFDYYLLNVYDVPVTSVDIGDMAMKETMAWTS